MQQYFINSGHHARARTPEGGPVIDGYLTGICPLSEPVQVPSDAPVIQVESENEYMPILTRLGGAAPARQSDGNGPRYRFRWYDIAGTSHIDLSDLPKYSVVWTQLGTYDANKAVTDCAEPTADISGKDHFVPAVLSNLDRWVRFGEAPPPSATFLLDSDNSIRRDKLGNAMGGVRPYWLSAPQGHVSPETDDTAAKKANPSPGLRVCGMLTHIEAMPEGDLKSLYPTPDVMRTTAEKQIEYLVKQRYLLPEEAALDLEKIRSTSLTGETHDER